MLCYLVNYIYFVYCYFMLHSLVNHKYWTYYGQATMNSDVFIYLLILYYTIMAVSAF